MVQKAIPSMAGVPQNLQKAGLAGSGFWFCSGSLNPQPLQNAIPGLTFKPHCGQRSAVLILWIIASGTMEELTEGHSLEEAFLEADNEK